MRGSRPAILESVARRWWSEDGLELKKKKKKRSAIEPHNIT